MQKSAATVQLHFALRALKVSRSINEVRKESVSKFRDCELPWAFAAECMLKHLDLLKLIITRISLHRT
jgi:hypothetical protein